MNVTDIVKALLNEDVKPITFKRSFTDTPLSGSITRRFNEILDSNPDLTDIIIALNIYPALVWNLNGQDIDRVTKQIANPDAGVRAIENVQNLIEKASGIKPSLMLERREAFYDSCRKTVDIINKAIDDVGDYPGSGELYRNILLTVIGRHNSGKISKFVLNKNIYDAISVMYMIVGNNLSDILDSVLDGYVFADEELAAVYHNTSLLLTEYNRILWYTKTSPDKAMKLLACKTEAEMLLITESDSKFCQAYLLAEYVKLIAGAIEMVRDFPRFGKEYYVILKMLLKAKRKNASDSDCAYEMGISVYSFSVKKRKALSVLGCILWGCDGDIFIKLLASEG